MFTSTGLTSTPLTLRPLLLTPRFLLLTHGLLLLSFGDRTALLRRCREVPDTFKGHTRRSREDRGSARHTLTPAASTRQRHRRHIPIHTHVIDIEEIVFIAADQVRLSPDENIIPAFTGSQEERLILVRATGEQIQTTFSSAPRTQPDTGPPPLINIVI